MDLFCSLDKKCLDEKTCKTENPFSIVALDKFTVVVEGNIACGKSSFLRHFEGTSSNLEVVQEPVGLWKDLNGHNVLELMYKDPQRWFCAFQSYVTLTILQLHAKQQKAPVRLIERSVHSARRCFVQNMYEQGKITDTEYRLLDDWYQWACADDKVRVDLIIYLRARPETCLERIKVRGRHEEESVPLSYLQQLHNYHEDWLLKEKFGKPPAPVLVIDTNCDLNQIKSVYEHHRVDVMCGVE